MHRRARRRTLNGVLSSRENGGEGRALGSGRGEDLEWSVVEKREAVKCLYYQGKVWRGGDGTGRGR